MVAVNETIYVFSGVKKAGIGSQIGRVCPARNSLFLLLLVSIDFILCISEKKFREQFSKYFLCR
jgi:hypothetical protein